jgi:hypothetical protein
MCPATPPAARMVAPAQPATCTPTTSARHVCRRWRSRACGGAADGVRSAPTRWSTMRCPRRATRPAFPPPLQRASRATPIGAAILVAAAAPVRILRAGCGPADGAARAGAIMNRDEIDVAGRYTALLECGKVMTMPSGAAGWWGDIDPDWQRDVAEPWFAAITALAETTGCASTSATAATPIAMARSTV